MAHDILVVDDEADIRLLICGILKDEGYDTRQAADGLSALEAIKGRRPSLVILDVWLGDSRYDGLKMLELIRQDHPDMPVLMISGHGTVETAVSAIKKGAYDFIEKPFKAEKLLVLVRRAIEATKLRREVDQLKLKVGSDSELVGTSSAINHVWQLINKVAPTGSRVLISGPAGVGKEVVARQLHNFSPRREAAFVALNCAMMHPDRLEEELFGTDSSSLSNGSQKGRKIGTFEKAHNGTLFLDEVVDMPLATQGKIVRVLQEQTFTREGGSHKVQVNVRVVASTSLDCQEEIRAGRLREDLYYRLNVVPIRVPALRERKEDIPLLVDHFMARASEVYGLPPRKLTHEALSALQRYDWPGNVRQLRNTIEWILIMASGDASVSISVDMLPADITTQSPAVLKVDKAHEVMNLPLREARGVFEREYMLAQLSKFSGNISQTAGFIGMERSALHRKLRMLNVELSKRSQ